MAWDLTSGMTSLTDVLKSADDEGGDAEGEAEELAKPDQLLDPGASQGHVDPAQGLSQGQRGKTDDDKETLTKVKETFPPDEAHTEAKTKPPKAEKKKATEDGRRRHPRRCSCYNFVVIIMDLALLVLSLVYPLLLRTRSKVILAESQVQPPSESTSEAVRATYAYSNPDGFFRDLVNGHLIADVYDGDLATMKRIISESHWVFVMYYAPWDAASVEIRDAFVSAASRLQNCSTFRFAAINCWWRHGSCRNKTQRMNAFPVFYAYNQDYQGFLYQGPQTRNSFLLFLDRLLHPFKHLSTDEDLQDVLATHDTVMVGHFNSSNHEVLPPSHSSNSSANNQSLSLTSFYGAALHFTQSSHHLSFEFLLITSPTLARDLQLPVNHIQIFRSPNSSLTYSGPPAGLIAWIQANASPSKISLVSKDGSASLRKLLTSHSNVSVFLLSPNLHSRYAFNPFYAEFRETALWFRACNQTYLQFFHQILRSARLRHKQQHFCCGKLKELQAFDPEFLHDFEELVSESYADGRVSQMPLERDEICDRNWNYSPPVKNLSHYCSRQGQDFYGQLRRPEWQSWIRQCHYYRQNPTLCQQPLVLTEAGVVADGILSVPAFAGLSCSFNRTVSFHYVSREDYPKLAEQFPKQSQHPLDSASLVILDNDLETSHLLKGFPRGSEIGWFIKNFTRNLITPFRRPTASRTSDKCLRNDPDACITELTSNSISRFVSSDSEVLVFFYTQSCGLCKTFNRYLLSLAKLLKPLSHFKIAQIEVDQNDMPFNLTVSRIPTLIFFGSNESHVFSTQKLSIASLISFCLRHMKEASSRKKLASRLCDRDCMTRNLEDVRGKAEVMKEKRSRITDEMLTLNEEVLSSQKEMEVNAEACLRRVEDVCRQALERLQKRIKSLAVQLELKAKNLDLSEKKLKTLKRIEAKVAWALYKS